MKSNFLCPLPWTSLSLQAESKPRVCCHQAVASDSPIVKNLSDAFSLAHNNNIQQLMLTGKVPKECQTCYLLETSGCESPRQEYIKKIPDVNYATPQISYVELTVDNHCNLQCSMCSPFYSVKLNKVFNEVYGTQLEKKWTLNYADQDLLHLLPQIKYLTLTGGEPFVSKNILNIIKLAATSGYAENIVLRIFSNLTLLPSDLASLFQPFKRVELFLSIDAVGEIYEKIRYPAKWSHVSNNVKKLKSLQLGNVFLNIHAVIMAENWLNLPNLIEFYNNDLDVINSILPVFVEISWPSFLHPGVLPSDKLQAGYESAMHCAHFYAKKKNLPAQIHNFQNLLIKIMSSRHLDKAIDNEIYWAKLNKSRRLLENKEGYR